MKDAALMWAAWDSDEFTHLPHDAARFLLEAHYAQSAKREKTTGFE